MKNIITEEIKKKAEELRKEEAYNLGYAEGMRAKQAEIDRIFAQEAIRNKGMIKVRGENGVTLMTKEQLAELDKNK